MSIEIPKQNFTHLENYAFDDRTEKVAEYRGTDFKLSMLDEERVIEALGGSSRIYDWSIVSDEVKQYARTDKFENVADRLFMYTYDSPDAHFSSIRDSVKTDSFWQEIRKMDLIDRCALYHEMRTSVSVIKRLNEEQLSAEAIRYHQARQIAGQALALPEVVLIEIDVDAFLRQFNYMLSEIKGVGNYLMLVCRTYLLVRNIENHPRVEQMLNDTIANLKLASLYPEEDIF